MVRGKRKTGHCPTVIKSRIMGEIIIYYTDVWQYFLTPLFEVVLVGWMMMCNAVPAVLLHFINI